jgi:Glyoxalase-like domain
VAFNIDHLFSLTRDREGARDLLTRMGFDLTERGEHPGRGTSNHLAFFGRCYWELLCVDVPTPENAALAQRGSGLVGCALRTSDAARDAQAARTLGVEAGEPEEFTRPVKADGEWRTARFRTAVLQPQGTVDAYLFFCQHLTPELVWPREPRDHPNGAFRIRTLQVVGPTTDEARRGFEPLLGAGGGIEPAISYDSVASYRARFGDAALPSAESRPRLASLELQVRDLDRCEAGLAQQRVSFQRSGKTIHCYSELIGHTIIFSA